MPQTRLNRVLYTATSDIHIHTFHLPYLRWLKDSGYGVDVAVENRADLDLSFCDNVYFLPFKRSPFHPSNLSAVYRLLKIIGSNNYSIVHCHTPAVSVLTRLAAIRSRRTGTKVVFTAHGFHFFKGAGLRNWMIYYPIEKVLSRFTDVIITINSEDYALSRKELYARKVLQINGMGVDDKVFFPLSDSERRCAREKLGFTERDFIVLMVGELNRNKNQAFILNALGKCKGELTNLKLVIIGRGPEEGRLRRLAASCSFDVIFLGWRSDVDNYAKLADLGISASIREGLGIALIEQMLCGVPIIASSNRGHREIVDHGRTGYLFRQGDESQFLSLFGHLYRNGEKRRSFAARAFDEAKKFTIDKSLASVTELYRSL